MERCPGDQSRPDREGTAGLRTADPRFVARAGAVAVMDGADAAPAPRLLSDRHGFARVARAPRLRCVHGERADPAAQLSSSIAFRIFFRSSMKRAVSSRRASSLGARRMDDGWTVAVTSGASGDFTNVARCVETLNFGPMTACAAGDPGQVIGRGLST